MIENTNKRGFLNLMKDYATLQANLTKVKSKIFMIKGKNKVENAVKSKADEIEQTVKKYGTKLKEYEAGYNQEKADRKEIIDEYKNSLENYNKIFSECQKDLIAQQTELETLESEKAIKQYELKEERKEIKGSHEYKDYKTELDSRKKELHKLIDSGDLEAAKAKMDEYKEFKSKNPLNDVNKRMEKVEQERAEVERQIQECENKLDELEQTKDNKLLNADVAKRKELEKVKKLNIWQKILGSMMHGKSKGMEKQAEIIGKIKQETEKIKNEVIPSVKDEVKGRTSEFISDVREKGKNISTAVRDKVVDTKDMVKDNVSKTYNDIISKGVEIKGALLDSMEAKIMGAEGKMQELTKEYSNLKEKPEANVIE